MKYVKMPQEDWNELINLIATLKNKISQLELKQTLDPLIKGAKVFTDPEPELEQPEAVEDTEVTE